MKLDVNTIVLLIYAGINLLCCLLALFKGKSSKQRQTFDDIAEKGKAMLEKYMQKQCTKNGVTGEIGVSVVNKVADTITDVVSKE